MSAAFFENLKLGIFNSLFWYSSSTQNGWVRVQTLQSTSILTTVFEQIIKHQSFDYTVLHDVKKKALKLLFQTCQSPPDSMKFFVAWQEKSFWGHKFCWYYPNIFVKKCSILTSILYKLGIIRWQYVTLIGKRAANMMDMASVLEHCHKGMFLKTSPGT